MTRGRVRRSTAVTALIFTAALVTFILVRPASVRVPGVAPVPLVTTTTAHTVPTPTTTTSGGP